MTSINPIQTNIDNTKSHKPHRPYREAEGRIQTQNNAKPLPGQGHLVHDSLITIPKYFLKDIAYDIKAVKDGFKGTANDHQSGRLNDVGLKLGGIGIATMLAARTTNPMARVMEYAGLGAFLASMSLYPLIAINTPSRLYQGFNIGKEYIDDQGRKKSVLQDPNYIPFDLYRGEYPGEDLDIIGDRLGVPRGIQDRHDVIKEQMRKIGIQNNTLWMMTAGVVPVMTALICCGLEKIIGPWIEKARNSNYNSKITKALERTNNMNISAGEIGNTTLSKNVARILTNYKNQELPKSEFDNLVKMFTKNLDANTAEGVKQDLANILQMEKRGVKSFVTDEKTAETLINTIRTSLPNTNKATLEKVFIPTQDEINSILKKFESKELTSEELLKFKSELKSLFDEKIAKEAAVSKESLNGFKNRIIENISKSIQKTPSNYVSEANIKEITDFAKILSVFKENDKILDKCKSFKFEHAPETVIARSYSAQFEKTLLDVLGVKYKELKLLRNSEQAVQEMLDKKLTELASNPAKYEEAVSKLGKIMSEMEIKLSGKSASKSHIVDLITAIENNYNNTAKLLNETGKGKFSNTIGKLVKEDVSTLSNSVSTRQELFDMLDGVKENKFADIASKYWSPEFGEAGRIEYAKENAKGVGSSKNYTISRIIERYQGANNSFNRILHTLDLYNRKEPSSAYDKEILQKGKEAMLGATSSDHTLKLNTINNPDFYKDVMNTVWGAEEGVDPRTTKAKGRITESTKNALKRYDSMESGNIMTRFQQYINRFRNIIGNNNIDFTKPEHLVDPAALRNYTKESKTRMSMFNLVSQTPVDFVKNAAERRYTNQKWARLAGTIGGIVLGGTILAQLGFGKIRNPHTLKKQVSDDASK